MGADTESTSDEEQNPLRKVPTLPGFGPPFRLPPLTAYHSVGNGGSDASTSANASLSLSGRSTVAHRKARTANSVTATLPTIPLVYKQVGPSSPAETLIMPTDLSVPNCIECPPLAAADAKASLHTESTFIDIDSLDEERNMDTDAASLIDGCAAANSLMSAGGLRSLSFRKEHGDDIVTKISSLNRADAPFFNAATAASATEDCGQQRGANVGAEGSIPVVRTCIPGKPTTFFRASGFAVSEDDWYDVTSASRSEQRNSEGSLSSEDGGEAAEAADGDIQPESRLDGYATSVPSTRSNSILMPTTSRPARSFRESLKDQRSFNNRVLMRQEAYADLQCFRAREYILSFFEGRGYQIDETRSSSSWSTQVSRRSSRNRIAVVHGTDFAERSPRPVPTDEERRVTFYCQNEKELYAKVARTYRVAGIPKGYLDALHIAEVQQGICSPRPQDVRRGSKSDSTLLSFSESNDAPAVLMRATDVELTDYNIDSAVQQVLWLDDEMGGREYARGAARGSCGDKSGVRQALAKFEASRMDRDTKRCASAVKETDAVANVATLCQLRQQGTAYSIMARVLWKNMMHFYYQHNAMSLLTFKLVKRLGDVFIGERALRLHCWDDPKSGYLATGVFDRTTGYPKNFTDPFTPDLYAEELKGGSSTIFSAPVLTRQHSAVNARCTSAEDGVILKGCSIVRQADVYGIYDGRVYGCQVAREDRDHRRTAIHAAIQSLTHYQNLFPKCPSLFRILHPQDRYRYPVVNPVGGMYCVPLIVNGAARLVKVDDLVPMDTSTGVFRCLTSSAIEFFPTLLEKALLKVNGGGVNAALMESCQVMHQLCGWIPLTIYFLTDVTGNELYWDGMLYASEMWGHLTEMYWQGRMLMSLVGLWESEEAKKASSFWRRHPLSRTQNFVMPISFPVVDVISRVDTTGGAAGRQIRAVMLRDTTKDPMVSEFVPPVQTSLSEAALSSIGYSDFHRESGVFCLTWEEAAAYFDHCSVSLNPSTLWSRSGEQLELKEATRLCCHGFYDTRLVDAEAFSQPQYHVRCSGVQASTQVFIVYTPHTSSQQPLPWPCGGLPTDTVDRFSDGGIQMRLSVFEVTTLPSILQVARDREGRPAQVCSLDNCVGRRLAGDARTPWTLQSRFVRSMPPANETPWMKTPLAVVSGYSNTMISLAFDVSPGTREYVVVMEAITVSNFRKQERVKQLSYTLTLYSDMDPLEQANPKCLPVVGGHATQSASEDSKPAKRKSCLKRFLEDDVVLRRLSAPTVTMHPIPQSLSVNSRTVQGVWSSRTNPQRTVLLPLDSVLPDGMWTGPQYRLHLSQPDDFCISLYHNGGNLRVSYPAALKVLLVRKTANQTEALVGSAADQCDLVLASRNADPKGVMLDSVSPHTVLLDRKRKLVRKQLKVRQEYHSMVYLTVYLAPRSEAEEPSSQLLIQYPNPSDSVQGLLVRAFAEGLLLSPEACTVFFMGEAIPLNTELRKLFANQRAGYTFSNKSDTWKPLTKEKGGRGIGVDMLSLSLYFDIDVESAAPFSAVHFPENEASGRLLSRLRQVARAALLAGSEQRTKALRALQHISGLIRESGLAQDRIEFLLGIARGIASWSCRSANRTAVASCAPPQMLPLLPAGDYVIVTCFVPTRPKENAESTKAQLNDAPGEPHTVAFKLKVELQRQRVELSAIPGTETPEAGGVDFPCSLLDEYFPLN
ncbi:putative calpain-like cysteine peptidase [Leptomonas seymouri]|uniref:Putative calpain-like cysteine peptidase n=1 Tax=Leptomonas seymouri TaxID=5684 RepID=A0A0N0P5P5_LEPSE|nr:putative calpain-like cysteine peptidase [Leptomonas seymouri]|eukprot:KPI86227.1 putative calpain-like cysteine peptidase [Leptomonas seymouri]